MNNFYRTKFLKNFSLAKTENSNILANAFFKKELDEPTYLTFRLDFGYLNDEMSKSLDYFPNPLLRMSDMANYYKGSASAEGVAGYSTYSYLKYNIAEPERAEALKSFIRELEDIQENYPYYFTNISGIGSLLKIKPEGGMRVGKDAMITVSTMEAIDQRISGMMNTYKKAVWDDVFQRWVVPDMMRWFNLRIYISEIRLFHNFERVPIQNDNGESKTAFELVNTYLNDIMPTMVLDCKQCEFVVDELNAFDSFSSSGTQNKPQDGPQIKIRIGNMMQYQMYPMFSEASFDDMETHPDGKTFNVRTGRIESVGDAVDVSAMRLTEKNILSDESLSRNGKYGMYDNVANIPSPISSDPSRGIKVYSADDKGKYSVSADANSTNSPALIKEMKDVESEIQMRASAGRMLGQIKQFIDTNAMLAMGANAGASMATNAFSQMLDKLSLIGTSDPVSLAIKNAAKGIIKNSSVMDSVANFGTKIEGKIDGAIDNSEFLTRLLRNRETPKPTPWESDDSSVWVDKSFGTIPDFIDYHEPANPIMGANESIAIYGGESIDSSAIGRKITAGERIGADGLKSVSASQSLTSGDYEDSSSISGDTVFVRPSRYRPAKYDWTQPDTILGLDANSMSSAATERSVMESTSIGDITAGPAMDTSSALNGNSATAYEWTDAGTIVNGIDRDSLERAAAASGKIDASEFKMPKVEGNAPGMFASNEVATTTTSADWTELNRHAAATSGRLDDISATPTAETTAWDSSSISPGPLTATWDASSPASNPLTMEWEERNPAVAPEAPNWDASIIASTPSAAEWDAEDTTTTASGADWTTDDVSASPSATTWNEMSITTDPTSVTWDASSISTKKSSADWISPKLATAPSESKWNKDDASASPSKSDFMMEGVKTAPSDAHWDSVIKTTVKSNPDWEAGDASASPSMSAVWDSSSVSTMQSDARWEAENHSVNPVHAEWKNESARTSKADAKWDEVSIRTSPAPAKFESVAVSAKASDPISETASISPNALPAKWEYEDRKASAASPLWGNVSIKTIPTKGRWESNDVKTDAIDADWANEDKSASTTKASWESVDTKTSPSGGAWEPDDRTTTPTPAKWQEDDKKPIPTGSDWTNEDKTTKSEKADWTHRDTATAPSEGADWNAGDVAASPMPKENWNAPSIRTSAGTPDWKLQTQEPTAAPADWKNIKIDETGSGDGKMNGLAGINNRKVVIPKTASNMPNKK